MGALVGRVALVTGSSGGIGAAIARRFAAEGARVAVHGRDVAALDRVRAELERSGATEAMRETLDARLGPVDVLVANAGGHHTRPGEPIEETTEEGWRASIEVGPSGIRVNCLAPETILTERNEERIPESQCEKLVQMHPIRRLGTPNDVAGAALFLVADQSDWITGVVLDVAGGGTMR